MQIKKLAFAALSLSLVCLVVPRASLADTLILTGPTSAIGPVVDGVYTYPYQFTVIGPDGTNYNVNMSCLNFTREIYFGEPWTVDAYNVLSIPTSDLQGFTETQFLADAILYNDYGTSAGSNSDLQFAIWAVMDASMTSGNTNGAYDNAAQTLESNALSTAASDITNNTLGAFANDEVFLPNLSDDAGNWNGYGPPQIFMVDPPPSSIAPEPSSLILLGTGLLGAFGAARRRLLKA